MNYRKGLMGIAAGVITLLFTSSAAFAGQVVRKAAGPGINNVIPTVSQFIDDLGGTNNPDGGSYTSGYRFLDWDEVPENVATGLLPPDFYNTIVPKGMVLSSGCSADQFKVSASYSSGYAQNFGNYNPTYTTDFQSLSGPRLFSAYFGYCNFIDVYFYIPGTKIPATVSGFGITFTDVDFNDTASIECFGVDGHLLGFRQNALQTNNGLSFLGVFYNAGERVAHVRIYSGNGALGENDQSHGGAHDIVVMDLLLFGEPHAIGQHSADFDGDGTNDLAVFRPSNGYWYVLESGSNTFVPIQFGQAGDVPVDGDFDGDSFNDLTVFRPSSGAWYTRRTSNGQVQGRVFGINGDKPVAGDYDHDGITDIAVWRPSNGNYYYLKSSNGQFVGSHFGAAGDIPIGYSAP